MDGFLFTENGWIQSYGSRCVRAPIIFDTIKRNEERGKPMTVKYWKQSQN